MPRVLLVGDGPMRDAAGAAGGRARRVARRGVRRGQAVGRAAAVLRGRRRVLHADPDPQGRLRGRRPRHRLPRGLGDRAAGGRRRLRRRAGRGARRRDRATSSTGRRRSGCAQALVSLLTDRAEARAMGSAGRAWAVQRWRWDSVVGAGGPAPSTSVRGSSANETLFRRSRSITTARADNITLRKTQERQPDRPEVDQLAVHQGVDEMGQRARTCNQDDDPTWPTRR